MSNKYRQMLAGTYDNGLSRWASIITIISFPTILIGLFLGYIEISDRLSNPEVELSFVHPTNVAYKVINTSSKTAEDILVSFGIFDITTADIVSIPSSSIPYVNQHSAKGPWSVLGKYGKDDSTYFGIIYVGCKEGKNLNTYWIYIKHSSMGESFYARRHSNDTYTINLNRLRNDVNYLDSLVIEERRIYIED